jgi:hypothetical protein
VEISGKEQLNLFAQVDTTAIQGKRGMLLLDPTNITIGATANINADGSTGDDISTATALSTNTNYGAVTSLITATQLTSLLNTTDVTLAATNNITVSSAITKTGATETTLTLNAGNNININAGISSANSKLNLTLNANSDNTGGGAVTFSSANAVDLNGGTLLLGNGSLTLGGSAILKRLIVDRVGSSTATMTASGGTLDGVTLGADLTVTNTLNLVNGLTLSGGKSLILGNSGSDLRYDNTMIRPGMC